MLQWYHFDWSHLISGLALLVITWSFKRLIALAKVAISAIGELASREDVAAAIKKANDEQLDKLRKEGLLNGIYVRNDENHTLLIENVRRLVRTKLRDQRLAEERHNANVKRLDEISERLNKLAVKP